jgi:hypothetical protein
VGYRDTDARHYEERLAFRAAPALVAINETCPRITTDVLAEAMSSAAASRIVEVHYRVNLEGLGKLEGSKAFHSVIPRGMDK